MADRRLFSSLPWLLGAAIPGAVGCFPADDGRDPPLDRFYFPVGLALGPDRADGSGPSRLYVVNSDFDLQFNAGTVGVYDLDRVRALLPRYCDSDSDCTDGLVCDLPRVGAERAPTHYCVDRDDPRPCGSLGEQSAAQSITTPGLCNFVDPSSPPGGGGSLLVQSVSTGAFATDALYRVNPLGGGRTGRLFVPVRGDSTLHWFDVDDDGDGASSIDCGQGSGQSCDVNHRRGADPSENSRDLVLPVEPFGIAADARGDALVLTHQTTGSVSLFVNRWSASDGARNGPTLEFVSSGLPAGALGIASVPESAFVRESDPGSIDYQPSFLVTFRNSQDVRRIRYFSDTDYVDGNAVRSIDPSRPFLDVSERVVIKTNSLGYDSRGIAVDARARAACESRCDGAADRRECLRACVSTGLDVFVANRTPSSLLPGRTLPNDSPAGTDDLPAFNDSIPIQDGPSRVYVGNVIDEDGALAPRVFIVCFDSKLIYVYDPSPGRQRIETQIFTGRGPQALAVDGANGLGYVAHFTDSYIGVVDLNKQHGSNYGKMVLTLGEPSAPRAAK